MDRLPWTRFHWLIVVGLGISWILDGLEIQIVSQAGYQATLGLSAILEPRWTSSRPEATMRQHRHQSIPPPPLEAGTSADPIRLQILATEHWSLLATRSMTWNEIFSRTGTFLTVLSATVIALSLAAQATGFGSDFRAFALLVLPIVLLVGFGTFIRLVEADIEDAWLIIGMNRLRAAYHELAPELEPYFVTDRHDDELGVLRTYSFRTNVGITHLLSGSPVIVGIIDAIVVGLIAGIITQAIGAPVGLQIAIGVLIALAALGFFASTGYRRLRALRSEYRAIFPSES